MSPKSLILGASMLISCRSVPPSERSAAAVCISEGRDSVRLNGDYAYVESPMAARVGSDLIMIGWQAVQRDLSGKVRLQSDSSFMLAGVKIDERSRAVALKFPGGIGEFHRPRVAAIGDTAVVVWRGGLTPRDTSIVRLWVASFANGYWSNPRVVGDWYMPELGISYGSSLVAQGNDLAIAVPGDNLDTEVIFRLSGAWSHRTIPVHSIYTALAPTDNGFLLGVIDGTRVKVASISKNGVVGPFIRVAETRDRQFHYAQLQRMGTRELAMAWVEGAMTDQSSVHVARSRDDGATWIEIPSLAVDGGLQSFDATARGRKLYVTGRQSTPTGPWPFAAILDGADWRVIQLDRRAGEVGRVSPRLSASRNSIDVYWGVNEEARADLEPPLLVHVSLARCAR